MTEEKKTIFEIIGGHFCPEDERFYFGNPSKELDVEALGRQLVELRDKTELLRSTQMGISHDLPGWLAQNSFQIAAERLDELLELLGRPLDE